MVNRELLTLAWTYARAINSALDEIETDREGPPTIELLEAFSDALAASIKLTLVIKDLAVAALPGDQPPAISIKPVKQG